MVTTAACSYGGEIRKRRRRHSSGQETLVAKLFRSRRVDGQPRQQHVAYLSSIPLDLLSDAPPSETGFLLRATLIGRTVARGYFWESAMAALEKVDGLTSNERVKIEAQLASRVPRTSSDALEAALRERRQMLKAFRA